MAVKLFSDAYEHTPQAEVIIERRPIMDEDNLKSAGTHHTWRINGTLIADGSTAIQAAIDTLEAAYVLPAVIALKDGATTLVSITATDCRSGIVVSMPPSYPIGQGQGQYATQRKYSIIISGDIYDGGEKGDPDILWLEETTSYTYDQHDKATRLIRGRLRTKDGVSAFSKFGTVTPSIPSGYNRMSYSNEINDDDNEMSYSFADVEYWASWPATVTGGSATETRSEGPNGTVRVSRSGSFQGAGAQALANIYKLISPEYIPISESQTVDIYDGSIAFSYEYWDTDSSETDYISFMENVNIEEAIQDFVIHTVLGGGTPVKQSTMLKTATCSQSGSAIGLTAFPTPPSPLWAVSDLKRKNFVKSGPERMPNGKYTNYRISWDYNYEFATTPTFHDPSTV